MIADRCKAQAIGLVSWIVAGITLAGCVSTTDTPQEYDALHLAAQASLSQQAVDDAANAPELTQAIRARAEHQPAEMARLLRQAADHGNPVAQLQLADLYRAGIGVSKDEKAAFAWALKSATQGLGEADVLLADSYFTGRGVVADPEIGWRWLHLAEEQERSAVWIRAAELYLAGVPRREQATEMTGPTSIKAVPANTDKAIDLLHRAALAQDEDGEVALCLLYMKGAAGLAPSPQAGLVWCNRAAAKGDPMAKKYATNGVVNLPRKSGLMTDVYETVEEYGGASLAYLIYFAVEAGADGTYRGF